MGLGNGNPKEGDKGSNFFWELKVLQGLEAIAVAIEAGGGGGGGGGGITALTGDVTAGPGSGSQVATIGALKVTTPKIANNAVTYAKMQLVNNFRFLGYADYTPGAPATANVTELPIANIPYFPTGITGTANSVTFLRGDGTWTTPASFTIQNSRSSLTARSFVNFDGTLTAVDEGAAPNTVTITGPTANTGIETANTLFKLGSPLNYVLNNTVTVGKIDSTRFLNIDAGRLVISSGRNMPGNSVSLTGVIGGGQLTSVIINNGGSGFNPGSAYSLSPSGGSPTVNATLNVQATSSIIDVVITNGGSGYPAGGTTVTFPAPTALGVGTNVQALGTPIIRNGVIVGVTITDPGSGYVSDGTLVVFSGVGGAGAVGRTVISPASITHYTITNPGSGYVTPPTIAFPATTGASTVPNVLITNSSSATGGTGNGNQTQLTVDGNTPNAVPLVDVVNRGGGTNIRTLVNFSGGTGLAITGVGAPTFTGIRMDGAQSGIQMFGVTSLGLNIVGNSANDIIPFAVSNSSATGTSSCSISYNGTPAGTTLVQNVLRFDRNNTIRTVVPPTVPNNSTNIDGVGSSLSWRNPFYNMPTDPPTSASFTGSISGTTLTVTAVASGTLGISQTITWVGNLTTIRIIALGSGSGGVGTYTISTSLVQASIAMTASGQALPNVAISAYINGIWRNADYDNAAGGLDFILTASSPTPLNPKFPTRTNNSVMRLRSDGQVTFPQGLPTSAVGLVTGDLYTQTTAELGIAGGGTQKVICIV